MHLSFPAEGTDVTTPVRLDPNFSGDVSYTVAEFRGTPTAMKVQPQGSLCGAAFSDIGPPVTAPGLYTFRAPFITELRFKVFIAGTPDVLIELTHVAAGDKGHRPCCPHS